MNKPTPAVTPIKTPLEMKELASVLVRHYGIHSGRYNLFFEFNIGVGAVGPSPDKTAPGAMIGISRIGLSEAVEDGPTTIDAAEVNPEPIAISKKIAAKKVAARK